MEFGKESYRNSGKTEKFEVRSGFFFFTIKKIFFF